MNAIAASYWRSIQRGVRTFAAVPASIQGAVRELARADAAAGSLSAEQYRALVGEEYEPGGDAGS